MASAEQAWNDLKIGQDAPENDAACNTACEQGPRFSSYCITKKQLDNLMQSSSRFAVLPRISPQCSAERFPEGTAIRAEIDNGEFPDTALLGRTLFDKYNRTLVIAGLALLVASIGVVVLSRRPSGK